MVFPGGFVKFQVLRRDANCDARRQKPRILQTRPCRRPEQHAGIIPAGINPRRAQNRSVFSHGEKARKGNYANKTESAR